MTDHPRVGGEHKKQANNAVKKIGSSPRGRGTLHVRAGVLLFHRIIPAWAGNTRR